MNQIVLLGDVAQVLGGGTPSTKTPEFWNGDIPWITPRDLSTHHDMYISKGDRGITQAGLARSSAKLLPAGAVIFSSRAPIGYVTIASKPMATNQGCKGINCDESKLDNRYLYYWLKLNKAHIESLAGGSTFKEISTTGVRNLEMKIPDVEIQKKSADILGTIDEKIELNRKMNETLEQMGQALFRHYFIDNPEAEAWGVKSLDEIATFLNGLAMQKYPRVAGEPTLPVIKIREMSSGITDNTDIASAAIPERYIINNGDLLFSWSGTLLLKFWGEGSGALNQHLFKVSSENYPEWLYYYWTEHHLDEFIRIAKSKATTMGHIQRKHLSQAKVRVPGESEMNQIGDKIQPILDAWKQNAQQIQSLATLRDTVLPRMISGKVRL